MSKFKLLFFRFYIVVIFSIYVVKSKTEIQNIDFKNEEISLSHQIGNSYFKIIPISKTFA